MVNTSERKLIVGCGYLGRRIGSLWLAQGHTVFATTRSEHHAHDLLAQGFQPILCDVLTLRSLSALPTVATVAYCIGLDRAAGRCMREVYIDGLANVLTFLPTPVRFVYVSSTSVYGQTGGEEVDENSSTNPLEESGKIVLEAEHLLRQRLPEAIILRFAGIYGPDRLLRRRQALHADEIIDGDPQRWLNLIYVDDGAQAVLAAEAKGQPGQIYNICDDSPVRRGEYYQHLADITSAPAPRFSSAVEEKSASQRNLNHRRIRNSRMHAELGLQLKYPTYQDGLPKSLN